MGIVGVLAQVVFDLSRQDKFDVFQRRIVDQPVQFSALVPITGDRVFYFNAVDGNHDAIVVSDFDAGGVDVVLTADSFHRILHYRLVGGTTGGSI